MTTGHLPEGHFCARILFEIDLDNVVVFLERADNGNGY